MPEFVLTLKDRELKRISIEKPELTIGRDPDDDLYIDNIGISRSHVKIRVTAQGDIFAMDNQSRNGTFINSEKISGRYKLRNGDSIQLAKYVITFSTGGSRLDMQKMRENARGSAAKPKAEAGTGAAGTLSFSADEIQRLVKANPIKQAEPDPQDMDPIARLMADEKKKREAQQELVAQAKPKTPPNLIVLIGMGAIIMLLLLIVVLLLKR